MKNICVIFFHSIAVMCRTLMSNYEQFISSVCITLQTIQCTSSVFACTYNTVYTHCNYLKKGKNNMYRKGHNQWTVFSCFVSICLSPINMLVVPLSLAAITCFSSYPSHYRPIQAHHAFVFFSHFVYDRLMRSKLK